MYLLMYPVKRHRGEPGHTRDTRAPQEHKGRDSRGREDAAAVQHNARALPGPPSTRATVAMDGGVADTARANTPY